MTNTANLRWQVIAAWCGASFEILFTIFWGYFGHNLPPAAGPALSAQALADVYIQNHHAILFGESMTALVGILWVPWTAQLTVAMWRIEGKNPVLTIIQLIGGILTAWVVVFCPAIWATIAFRTDTDPGTMRVLNDLGYILFNVTYAGTSLQAVAAGIVGLADRSARPMFPRWVSWWAIFTGVSFLPITAMPFFKTGPLAWDGGITFWALFFTYFVWCASMGTCMVRAAQAELRNDRNVDLRVGIAGAV